LSCFVYPNYILFLQDLYKTALHPEELPPPGYELFEQELLF
jgi:hypothetical protein